MRTLLLLCALALFASCSSVDRLADKAKIPRDIPVEKVQRALATPDLDKDGNVNGLAEWLAFLEELGK